MLDVPQPASIVIIDDNASNLEFAAEALARSGLQILTSTQPETGLALVAAHNPRIVLTDVIMPGINGYHVLRMVKQLNPAIDVVLMSAADLAQADDTTMELAAGFLRKPISMAELRGCVARLLENKQRPVPTPDC
ncbi:MAG TPA: response regulator [Candidatus Angelobacter sp.]|nr:response regulator [Candidatus Angelobacter sp.]